MPQGARQAVFPLSEGDVTFTADLSTSGLTELGEYLDIFLKKQKRGHTVKAQETPDKKEEAAK